jgi:phospholipase C
MTSPAIAPGAGAVVAAATPTLTRISVAADGSIWGVDNAHAAWQYALATEPWTAYGSMKWVACASDGSVFALDPQGGFHQRDADGSWQPLAGLDSGKLAEIAALSASLVWGVDGDGAAHTWDGTKWNPAPALPNGDLFASVDISSDGTVWALGRSQTAYQSLAAPANWQVLTPPEKVTALAAGAPGWIWAIGVSGTCYRWAGADANPPWPTVPAAPARLEGLACGDDASVWAFDGSGGGYVFDLTGNAWQPVAGPDGGTFACLSAADGSTVWAVTEKDGAFTVFQYTSGLRTWQAGSAPVAVQDVAVTSSSDVWAVGVDYSVHRCQNGKWGPDPVSGALKTIDAASDGTVCGTAEDGTAWRYVGGSTVWDKIVCQVRLSRVAVGSSSTIVGIDEQDLLYRYDGTPVWPRVLYDGASGCFADVAVGEEGLIWAVDSKSTEACAYLGDGMGWLETGVDAVAIGCATAADVWAVTTAGLPIQLASPTGLGEAVSSGAVAGVAPRWDTEDPFDETKSTHLWIVNRAAQLAGGAVADLVQPGHGRMSGPGSDFHNQLCQGLYDADFVPPYNDKFVWPWWISHFYDPDTGLNYKGDEEPTALSRGVACATAAVDFMAAEDQGAAGYQLGLALHYLTDLTQPMHAANFSWFSSHPYPGFHSAFETYVLTVQAAVSTPSPYQPKMLPDLASYYRATAANSKSTWFDALCSKAESIYVMWTPGWAALVQPLVAPMLQAAIQETAQFLTAWVQAVSGAEPTQLVTLISASSGQVADIPHNKWNPPLSFVQQWQWNGGPNQSWTAVPLAGADAGWYRLASPLHPVLGVGADQKTVVASEWSPTNDSLKWKLVVGPDGSFAIQNKATQLWLTCGAPTAKGSWLTVAGQTGDATQQWFMALVGAVVLKCVGTGQVMDVSGNSKSGRAIVDQWPQKPWGDAQNQEWLRVPLVGVGEESYALLNRNSGLALDVSGTQVIQQAWLPGSPSQAWGFDAAGSTSSYHVVNRSTPGRVVTPAGPDPTKEGLALQIEPLVEGAADQQWQIVAVPLGS